MLLFDTPGAPLEVEIHGSSFFCAFCLSLNFQAIYFAILPRQNYFLLSLSYYLRFLCQYSAIQANV